MSRILHKFIQAHIEAEFPGIPVKCATNPNEEWIAVVGHVAYLAVVDGDSEGLTFHAIQSKGVHGLDTFEVILTDDEMIAAVRERDGT